MRRIGLWVVAVVLLGAGEVRGQGAGEPPAAAPDREVAQQKARQGMEAFEAGRFVEAARLFQEAQALFPHPSNLFNAAKAWEKAAEYQKAADAYRAYLDLFVAQNQGAEPPDAEDVRRTIDVMREKAFLALPEVTIDSDPQGADIYVDDPERLLGQTPFTTHLPEGTHKVFLRKPGYQGFEREFLVRSREPLRLTFALERIRNDGFLRVFVNIRKARIYVDGKVVAASPLEEPLRLEAGRHQVLVEKDDYTQKAEVVEIHAGAVTDVQAELVLVHNPFSWRGGVGVASMILGAGGLGAGFWLRYEANKEFNTTDRFKTYRTWAYVGYGVGSGLLALGTGLVIWEYTRKAVRPEDRLEARTTWAPFAIPGPEGRSAVVGVSGSW
ncbi:MAG TPA: PEGA domain-containing protein [Myxococcota bacterium]|nr:PEGA domain-containing protein [Myxococcota bacterium]HQK50533.1 PEGA domain-containing protein [Myxococcota bacterium]